MIISTNPETGETAEKRVLETYVRKSNELVHIWIDGQETKVTPEHRYYVPDKGWINAKDLKPGDLLRTPVGDYVTVQEVVLETLDEPVTVYNFEVEDFHTYYAGNVLVLVHNANYAPRRPVQGVTRQVDHPDGSTTYTRNIDGREVNVTYNRDGYPDFRPFAHPDYPNPVEITVSGRSGTDTIRANREVGISGIRAPEGYTWHHLPDGRRMLLVQQPIHDQTIGGFAHTGGASIVRNQP